eukprot:scaffold3394_cov23-Cyclotella_meneghiniana.AAC.3
MDQNNKPQAVPSSADVISNGVANNGSVHAVPSVTNSGAVVHHRSVTNSGTPSLSLIGGFLPIASTMATIPMATMPIQTVVVPAGVVGNHVFYMTGVFVFCPQNVQQGQRITFQVKTLDAFKMGIASVVVPAGAAGKLFGVKGVYVYCPLNVRSGQRIMFQVHTLGFV